MAGEMGAGAGSEGAMIERGLRLCGLVPMTLVRAELPSTAARNEGQPGHLSRAEWACHVVAGSGERLWAMLFVVAFRGSSEGTSRARCSQGREGL